MAPSAAELTVHRDVPEGVVRAREEFIRDYVAEAPAPRPTSWKRADLVEVHPERVDPFGTREVLSCSDTVMGVSVAPGSRSVAVLDYGGGWRMAAESSWSVGARGTLDGRGRDTCCAPDGSRFAALLATGPWDTRYAHDAVLVSAADGSAIPCLGERVTRAAWTPDSRFVVLTGVMGYRVHATSGECLFGDQSPKGWLAACVTHDASRVFFVRRGELRAMQLGAGDEIEAPDASPYSPPAGNAGLESSRAQRQPWG